MVRFVLDEEVVLPCFLMTSVRSATSFNRLDRLLVWGLSYSLFFLLVGYNIANVLQVNQIHVQ